jgi:hypothetical protein
MSVAIPDEGPLGPEFLRLGVPPATARAVLELATRPGPARWPWLIIRDGEVAATIDLVELCRSGFRPMGGGTTQ